MQTWVYMTVALAGLITTTVALWLIRAREHQARKIREDIHQAR